MAEKAIDKAQKLLADHEVEPLPQEMKKEIDSILNAFEGELEKKEQGS